MTRWSVGDKLLGEIDGTIPNDLEIRTVEGSYWQRLGGAWEALTGPATSVSSERLFDADRPAVVTYVPSVPAPHTKPGHYVCTGECAYRYTLEKDGTWVGPFRPDGTNYARGMTWEELEDNYSDCSVSLVGPVPASVLKGL
jgi:hypothetical protein